MKEILGLITIVLALFGNGLYIRSILKHKTKPHLFTWLCWSISSSTIFIAQFLNGAGPGSWGTSFIAVFAIFIAILSFKYGTKDITFSDKIYLSLSLFSILLWFILKNPFWSVVTLVTMDFFAFFPTIRKTIKDPRSENSSLYSFGFVRHLVSILAMKNYSIITTLFPAMLVVMNFLMISIFVYFRKLR